jgi:hypothetical protein
MRRAEIEALHLDGLRAAFERGDRAKLCSAIGFCGKQRIVMPE